jgi:type IV pilus assembly protein PilZ
MSTAQQRRAPRVPIEVRVEYKRINAFIADFTRDISSGGLFIRTSEPLAVGTEAMFTLSIPRMERPVTLKGRVQRVIPSDDAAEMGMGIELLFDDETERSALKRVVDTLMIEHLGDALYRRLVEAQRAND